MSGRELDPDGTDSHHPQHPWEQARHPLYLPPGQRTQQNWPPEPAQPAGPVERHRWAMLPTQVTHGICHWCGKAIRYGRAAGPPFWAHATVLGAGYRIQCEGRDTRATPRAAPRP